MLRIKVLADYFENRYDFQARKCNIDILIEDDLRLLLLKIKFFYNIDCSCQNGAANGFESNRSKRSF